MIIIKNNSTDPAFNLSLEEILLTGFDDEIFMLWQNERSVIVGCNQNTVAEIDRKAALDNQVKIVRRLTGGGAVYHDLGNLNFTFIKRNAKERFLDFQYFNAPIIELLISFGFEAVTGVRNDILIDGKKISGNAQKMYKNSTMHHGTLLFDVSMDVLQMVLKPNPLKMASKAINSVRSRVANLNELSKDQIDLEAFKNSAEKLMLKRNPSSRFLDVQADKELLKKVEQLKTSKYDTWEWNYGASPEYELENCAYTSAGLIEVKLNVKDGIVRNIKFFGDFSGIKNISELESLLTGVNCRLSDILEVFEKTEISNYINNISNEELAALIAQT